MLRLYAVIRADLSMTPGKAASQAGHAFVDSLLKAPDHLARAYLEDGHGTKVVLVARGELALRRAFDAACLAGLPCAMVIDSGHVMPPHFDGSPILTALGIGPATREAIAEIIEEFRLMP